MPLFLLLASLISTQVLASKIPDFCPKYTKFAAIADVKEGIESINEIQVSEELFHLSAGPFGQSQSVGTLQQQIPKIGFIDYVKIENNQLQIFLIPRNPKPSIKDEGKFESFGSVLASSGNSEGDKVCYSIGYKKPSWNQKGPRVMEVSRTGSSGTWIPILVNELRHWVEFISADNEYYLFTQSFISQ